jgi:hypothetical protein
MHTVEVLLNPSELSEGMNAMRAWLDQQGYEPSRFSSRELKGKILLSASFTAREAAEAFASRFTGRLSGSKADHLLTQFPAPVPTRA